MVSLWNHLTLNERRLIKFLLAYSIVIGLYVYLRHYVFQSLAYDLGIFSQALWTTVKEGLFFYETPDFIYSTSGSFFGVHFSPIMFILVPIYALFPSPLTLIFLQIFIIVLSAIVLYKLCVLLTKREDIGFWVSVLFVLHPATIGGLFYDFHLEIFYPLFLFFSLYSLEKRDYKTYYLFLFLTLTVLDFASLLLVLSLLVYSSLFRGMKFDLSLRKVKIVDKELLHGSLLFFFIVYIPYGLLTIYGISFFGKFPFSTSTNWYYLGSGIFGILKGLLNPINVIRSIQYDFSVKLLWITYTFGALLLLPFIRKREVVLFFPPIFMFLVSTYRPYYQYGFQYGLIYFPLVLYGYIVGLNKILEDKKKTSGEVKDDLFSFERFLNLLFYRHKVIGKNIVVVSVFLILILYPVNIYVSSINSDLNFFGGRAFIEPLPIPNDHINVVYEAISVIPEGASVLAQMNIFPHLSHRVDVYVWLPESKLYDVEYAIADTKSPYFNVNPPGIDERYSETFNKLLESGLYQVIFNKDGVIVLRKIVV